MPFVGEVDLARPPRTPRTRSTPPTSRTTTRRPSPAGTRSALDSGAAADLAVSDRGPASAEFTFPTDSPAGLLFRTSNSLNGSEDAEIEIDPRAARSPARCSPARSAAAAPTAVRTTARRYYRLLLQRHLRPRLRRHGTWKDDDARPGAAPRRRRRGVRHRRGPGRPRLRRLRDFDTTGDDDVRMRLGISYVSLAGAEANLARRDSADRRPSTTWRRPGAPPGTRQLAAIRVSGGTDAAAAPRSTPRSTTRCCSPT